MRNCFVLSLVVLLATWAIVSAQQPAPGYLGLRPVPAAPGSNAIVIEEVDPNGPGAKAGLKRGDRIVKINDQALANPDAFSELLAKQKPGDKLAIVVVRDGKEQNLEVTLGERPAQERPPDRVPAPGRSTAFLGVHMQDLSPPLKAQLGVDVDQGVHVADVTPNSPAAKAGLQAHDVITQAGDKPVANARQLSSAIQQAGAGKEIDLKFVRGKETKQLKVTLAEPPADVPPARVPARDPRLDIPRVGEDASRVRNLERRIEELEKRIQELEKKLNK